MKLYNRKKDGKILLWVCHTLFICNRSGILWLKKYFKIIKKEWRNMKETKKQILIRLNKNTDLIKKEERKNKNSATRHLANLLNGTSGKKLFRG